MRERTIPRKGVLGQIRIAWIPQNCDELRRQADAFVERPQRQQTGVGGEWCGGRLDLNG